MQHRVLSLKDVCRVTSLKKSSIYNLLSTGQFPTQIALTPGRRGFLESEIIAWVESRQRVTR